MKICPRCQAQVDDNTVICPSCGTNMVGGTALTIVPEWDHTAEFDPKDISDNKVIAMLVYLIGIAGIIIALLAGKESPYVAFHVRQRLKIAVLQFLTVLAVSLLFWTCIVLIAGCIFIIVLQIIDIICFVFVCKGKAIEPVIIRDLKFLK